MKTLLPLALALTLTLGLGCSDDEPKDGNGSTNVATNVSTGDAGDGDDGGMTGEDSGSTGDDAGTSADSGGEVCENGEAFDAPLDTCVTCPNVVYMCEDTIALFSFDRATSTVTFAPADGDASFAEVTLGGQRLAGSPEEMNQEFTVEGTVDGRTWSFDVSGEETSEMVQLNNLTFTDSCDETFNITFVANYSTSNSDPVDPFCPLGG